MSFIQLPSGVVEDNKSKIKLNLPRNYNTREYFKKLPYLNDVNDPAFQNSVVDVVNNRDDICKFLLATRNKGRNIHANLNAIITDGRLNDAIVRHVLDAAGKNVLANPNPLQVAFKDLKKSDA